MASLIPEIAVEETLGDTGEVASDPGRRRGRPRFWRAVVLLLAGVYFLIPLYAGAKFSLQNDAGHFSLYAVKAIPSQTGFGAAFFLSLRLAALTVVLSIVLMVPTAVYVHLKLPKMRRVLDFVTILPIVIPPIVLILGVLGRSAALAEVVALSAEPHLRHPVASLRLPFAGLGPFGDRSQDPRGGVAIARRKMGEHAVARDPPEHPIGDAVSHSARLSRWSSGSSRWRAWTSGRRSRCGSTSSSRLDAHIATAVSMLSLHRYLAAAHLIVSLDRSQSRRTRRRRLGHDDDDAGATLRRSAHRSATLRCRRRPDRTRQAGSGYSAAREPSTASRCPSSRRSSSPFSGLPVAARRRR